MFSEGANSTDIICGQLRHSVPLATIMGVVNELVGVVLGSGRPTKMPRINTQPIPATVGSVIFALRRRAVSLLANNAMNQPFAVTYDDFAISVIRFGIRPEQALILLAGDRHVFNERLPFGANYDRDVWIAMDALATVMHRAVSEAKMRLLTPLDRTASGRLPRIIQRSMAIEASLVH